MLEAGAVCFGEKGFFEATFEDVVHRSGISRGSVYWYFESKEALYNAVLEHCAARLKAAFDAGVEELRGDGPIVAKFLRSIERDVDAQEEVYRVLYLAPRPAAAAEQLTQLTLLFVSYVRLVVAAARRRQQLDEHSDDALVDIVHALAEGLVIRRLCDPTFEVARYIATAAELLDPN